MANALFCGAWILAWGGVLEKSIHSLLAGVKDLVELNGDSPLARMQLSLAMIFTDIGSMILTSTDIMKTVGELWKMRTAITDLASFGKALFDAGPQGPLISALSNLKDDLLELSGIKDLTDDINSFNDAANEFLAPYGYTISPT